MKRAWHTWIIFAVCLVVVLAAMAWISFVALRLERSEARMQRTAAFEEDVRLALWRMDSALGPSIARENARPWFVYSPFYRRRAVYALASDSVEQGDVLVPSPLLTSEYPNILLFFQFDPDGALTSPQTPADRDRELAEGTYATTERIEQAAQRLREFQAMVSRDALLNAMGVPSGPADDMYQRYQENVEAPPSTGSRREYAALRTNVVHAFPVAHGDAVALSGVLAVVGAVDETGDATPSRNLESGQSFYNLNEFDARNRMNTQATTNAAGLWNVLPEHAPMPPMTPLQAVWIGDALILARTVSLGGRQHVQGCWLDWSALQTVLLDEIRDLLPNGSLVPGVFGEEPGRTLAALPVRIVPGDKSISTAALASPIRFSLVIAWACIVLGAVAVAALLVGALRLSERRGAFVSAVTHELRTPLTTFRIYTDLLAKSPVQDEAKRRQYVTTLSAEADRLSHLVENVLAYSRLTGRAGAALAKPITVSQLLDRVTERLADRATRADMQLVVEHDDCVKPIRIATDESIVEQILLNLVDNACKYAVSADDHRIHLQVTGTDGAVTFRVRDHGPGVPRDMQHRIFRAFSKSAHEAAHTAAGIGLGLALSRRLARDMGGDLRLRAIQDGGACFELELPTA